MKKVLSIILALIIMISAVFLLTSCGDAKTTNGNAVSDVSTSASAESIKVGEGATSFEFKVVHTDGSEKKYLVSTDKTTVGDALYECGLIDGEESTYGLYVKIVDGKTLDYDKDGKYWAFYVDGEMSPVGVDMAEIEPDKTYSFRAE